MFTYDSESICSCCKKDLIHYWECKPEKILDSYFYDNTTDKYFCKECFINKILKKEMK